MTLDELLAIPTCPVRRLLRLKSPDVATKDECAIAVLQAVLAEQRGAGEVRRETVAAPGDAAAGPDR